MIFEKDGKRISLEEFEKITGAKWAPKLEYESNKVFRELLKQGEKLYKKGDLTLEQIWLGKYFKQEITLQKEPNLAIRYIDSHLGWGVFAMQNFRKMEFIAEYVGKVRKRKKEDEKNGYCFEWIVTHGVRSSYTIDAMDQGGISRYINHSEKPNLESALATFDHLSHIILFAKEPIAKGEQLCYDYGPDYWSKRTAPIPL